MKTSIRLQLLTDVIALGALNVPETNAQTVVRSVAQPRFLQEQDDSLESDVQQLQLEVARLNEALSQQGQAVPAPSGAANSAMSCGCPIGRCSCLCPTEPAPCIDCPHVSTLGSNSNVSIFGALKADFLYNSARPAGPGTPFFLTPGSQPGFDESTFDAHARQSLLGAAVTGPKVGQFQAGGLFSVIFFDDNVIADKYGVLPIQADGDLKNDNWRIAAGLQFDVFNPMLPTILPFSALSASGNSGNAFRGQLRVERFLTVSDQKQWTLQAAISDPVPTTIDPTLGALNENAGWPNIESRIALGLGPMQTVGAETKRPFELGLFTVVGQLQTTQVAVNQIDNDVWGVGGDFRWRVNPCWGLAAEFYTGQSLGTYNGGVLQSVNRDTLGTLRSTGGWCEVYRYWTPCVHSHFGFGIDDPLDRDVALAPTALGRVRNETYFANLLWDVSSSFRIAMEATWRETTYRSVPDNEGYGLQTQLQWSF